MRRKKQNKKRSKTPLFFNYNAQIKESITHITQDIGDTIANCSYGVWLDDYKNPLDSFGCLNDSYSFEDEMDSVLKYRVDLLDGLGRDSAAVGMIHGHNSTIPSVNEVMLLNSKNELKMNRSDRYLASRHLSRFTEDDKQIIMPEANSNNKMYLTFNRSMESSLEEVYNVQFKNNIRFRSVKNFIRFNIDKYDEALALIMSDGWKIITQNDVSSVYSEEDYKEYPDLSPWGFRQSFMINDTYPDILLDYSADLSKGQAFVLSHLHQKENFVKILESLEQLLKPFEKIPKVEEEIGRINIITTSASGFQLRSINIEVIKDPTFIQDNYNDDFGTFHEMLTGDFENRKTGLFLLHGDPGTGKTNYIRYLISQNATKKKIIYIPPEMAHHIASPNFINFMIDNSDSILVLEDAENVLLQRQSGDGQAVANLLNLTDGLLGTLMQCLVVCTFNCAEEAIDKALLRKGRLLGKYKFEKLDAPKANAILNKKFNLSTDKPMTLAEIYNADAANDFAYKDQKRAFGFNK